MKGIGSAEKDAAPRKENTGIVTIIAALIVLVGTIYASQTEMRIQKSIEQHDIYMRNLENAHEQKFYMSEEMITRTGIEHIRYEIEAEPAINGFHIIPYVYIEIEISGEKKYIPVEGQFLQKEYVAGQDGRCTLYRENTKEELLDKLKELGCEAQAECMIAIEYVVESKPEKNIFELRTGQLVVAEKEKVIAVMAAWEEQDYVKIDMTSWPVESERQLKELLKLIGY